MIFQEERESYPTQLEAFKTDDYSVVIDIRPADEEQYDPMYSQSIELNALDIRALANELNRLANEIEKEAKKPGSNLSESKVSKNIQQYASEVNHLSTSDEPVKNIQEYATDMKSTSYETEQPKTEQSMTKQKETKENTDMNSSSYRKKNTADVHSRYVKNGNGQMELMTAV